MSDQELRATPEYLRLKEKGREYLQGGQFCKAVDAYTRALTEAERIRKSTLKPRLQEGDQIEIKCTCQPDGERPAVSSHAGCRACQEKLDLPVCFSNRAMALTQLGKFREALLDAERTIELVPHWTKGFFRKADALAGLKKYDEAKAIYGKIIMMEPANSASFDLLNLRILKCDLDQQATSSNLYFRTLRPGEEICKSTWNPLTKIIYEFAKRMQNIVYLIGDQVSKECIVVDPCWDVDGILKEVANDGMTVKAVIATHNHFDHVGGRPPAPFDSYRVNVGGVAKLLEKCEPNVKVYVNEEDYQVFLEESLTPADRIIKSKNKDKLKIGNHELVLIHTPGHTPGSQCIQIGQKVLTGDTLFCGSCGRVDFPGGNASQLYDSLFKILGTLDERTALFPAHSYHGKMMTSIAYERKRGILRPTSKEEFCLRLTRSLPTQ